MVGTDLSDIMDVPEIVQFNIYNRPMFNPTYFSIHLREHPSDISTRLRCYQTGVQTTIAGPWIYSNTDKHPFPKESIWLDFSTVFCQIQFEKPKKVIQ